MEDLNSVNAEVAEVVTPQEQVENNVESVNADNGESTSTQQDTKPVQTPEENAKFAEQRRAREAAEKESADIKRDYNISKTYGKTYDVHSESEIAEKYGHLGITTFDQFKEAVRLEEMKEKGVDPEAVKQYANELPEVKAAREWQESQKKNAVYNEFLDYFKTENNRDFDSTKDQISQEVWDMVGKGKSLVDAYAINESKALKARIKAMETNQANAAASTGSVTGNGSAKDTTLTPEMIDKMTPTELMSRWSEVKKVTGMK